MCTYSLPRKTFLGHLSRRDMLPVSVLLCGDIAPYLRYSALLHGGRSSWLRSWPKRPASILSFDFSQSSSALTSNARGFPRLLASRFDDHLLL
jgi:hypothetical protein